jgi:hypothetical protein
MSKASAEGLPVSSWGSFPGLAKLADYVSSEVTESESLEVWKSVSYRVCNSGSLEDGPSTATGGTRVWPVSGTGRPDRSPLSPAARVLVEPLDGEELERHLEATRPKRVANLEAATRKRRSKAEEALLEALRRLQARGGVFATPLSRAF